MIESKTAQGDESRKGKTGINDVGEYVKTLLEVYPDTDTPDLLEQVAYVFLDRMDRIALAWRIFKQAFRR